jgi:cation:H+ antiporter
MIKSMGGLYLTLWVLVLSLVLGKVSEYAVASVRRLSLRFKVNEFIAAFFFLGVATSIPEMAVAIFSAIRGVPQLSFGNLIGSKIVILTLLVGLAAVLSGKLSIHKVISKQDFLLTLLVVGLPVIFILDGSVSRFEGFLMLAAYGYFLLHFFRRRGAYHRPARTLETPGTLTGDAAIFIATVAVLLVISYFLVQISLTAATALGIPVLVVGLLMISLGTNVPEVSLVFGQAFKKYAKDSKITIGVLLGNVVFSTVILGVLALLHPFAVDDVQSVWVAAGFLTVIVYATWVFFLSEGKLSRREGVLLLLLYVLFVGYQLGLFERIYG